MAGPPEIPSVPDGGFGQEEPDEVPHPRRLFVRPLTPFEREQLEEKLHSSDSWVFRRSQIIVASAEGRTPVEIGRLVGRNPQMVRQVIRQFNENGLASLERPVRTWPSLPMAQAEPESTEPSETVPTFESGPDPEEPVPVPQLPQGPRSSEQLIFVDPLTTFEREQIEEKLRSSDAWVLRRCHIILASNEGQTPEQIAVSVGFSAQAVASVIEDFNHRRLAILVRDGSTAEPVGAFAPQAPQPPPPAPRFPRPEGSIFVDRLTPYEREQLEENLRSSDGWVLRRCHIILASNEGQTPEQIAVFAGFSAQAVASIIQDFNHRRLAILIRDASSTEPAGTAVPQGPQLPHPADTGALQGPEPPPTEDTGAPEGPEPPPTTGDEPALAAMPGVSRLERVSATLSHLADRVPRGRLPLSHLADRVPRGRLPFRRQTASEADTEEAPQLRIPAARPVVQPATPRRRRSRSPGVRRSVYRFLRYMTFVPLFLKGRAALDAERLEIDRPRRVTQAPMGEIRRRVYILRESIYSHRRLQLVVIVLALLFMLSGTGAAVYFNRTYAAQKEVKQAILVMANANSYASKGR